MPLSCLILTSSHHLATRDNRGVSSQYNMARKQVPQPASERPYCTCAVATTVGWISLMYKVFQLVFWLRLLLVRPLMHGH